ncbi:MAG: hypothetical protein M3Y59_03020 [Myxococcota bacterium]|nr:hypothetical protein [Myxococcota bacterium]
MKRTLMTILALALPSSALAQAELKVRAPVVTFEVAPMLVVVSPGIQVVPDYGEEVFFTNGWYWVRQDRNWFKSRSHRGGWKHVGHKHVPRGLYGIPHGHYRHYKHHDRREHRGDHRAKQGSKSGHSEKGGGDRNSKASKKGRD